MAVRRAANDGAVPARKYPHRPKPSGSSTPSASGCLTKFSALGRDGIPAARKSVSVNSPITPSRSRPMPNAAPHRAARPVGPNHEPGPHLHTAHRGAHPIGRRPQGHERRTEAHLAAAAAHLVDQHGFEVVLRHQGREGRARGHHLAHRRPCQRHHLGRRVGEALRDRDRRLALDAPGQHRVRDPPAAHQLHGADRHAGGPRHGRRPGPAFDDEHACAVARRGDGGREACRARAHDKDVSGEHAAHDPRRPDRRRPYRIPT